MPTPIKKVCEIIKKNKSFLITAHYDPEGDSLGSQLAMAEILRQLGKKYVIVDPDKVPGLYGFLKNINDIQQPSKKTHHFDAALVLDCPIMERIGKVADIIGKKPVINIDHHVSNRNFGVVNYVQPKASSTGEIMYDLAKALGCKMNKDLAAYIYVAMLTDTGGFRYSNTTSETMHIAAELMKFGVSPKHMYEMIYESHSLASRKLLGLCLGTLRLSPDGRFAWMHLTKAMFKKAGATALDAENFVNYPRFVEGVKIAVLFSDVECSRSVSDTSACRSSSKKGHSIRHNAKKGFTKVNFRSNETWADVNKIASKFGGGGHISASGCIMKGSLKAVEKKILKEVRKVLSK